MNARASSWRAEDGSERLIRDALYEVAGVTLRMYTYVQHPYEPAVYYH